MGMHLSFRRWTFWYDERRHALVVDRFASLHRPSKRHKFVVVSSYNRIDRRHNDLAEAPPLPPEIAAQAKDQFVSSLRVMERQDRS